MKFLPSAGGSRESTTPGLELPNLDLNQNVGRSEFLAGPAQKVAENEEGGGWSAALHPGADDRPSAHSISPSYFSTKKLPRTNASMPELKKVRIASVGVCTMASPRRLKEVFIITGTPVRLPNSSMRR